jgi:predicted acyl esterase
VEATARRRLCTALARPADPQPNATTTFDLNGNAWRFRAGDKLRIELAQDDAPYIKRSTQPSSLTLAGVTLQLPIR